MSATKIQTKPFSSITPPLDETIEVLTDEQLLSFKGVIFPVGGDLPQGFEFIEGFNLDQLALVVMERLGLPIDKYSAGNSGGAVPVDPVDPVDPDNPNDPTNPVYIICEGAGNQIYFPNITGTWDIYLDGVFYELGVSDIGSFIRNNLSDILQAENENDNDLYIGNIDQENPHRLEFVPNESTGYENPTDNDTFMVLENGNLAFCLAPVAVEETAYYSAQELSNDGEHLLALKMPAGELKVLKMEDTQVDLTTNYYPTLLQNVIGLGWSPDSEVILAVVNNSGGYSVVARRKGSGELWDTVPTFDPPLPVNVENYLVLTRFSSDNNRVAVYTSFSPTGSNTVTIYEKTGVGSYTSVKEITISSAAPRMALSPDGKYLAVCVGQLYIYAIDSIAFHVEAYITQNESTIETPVWVDDNTVVLSVSQQQTGETPAAGYAGSNGVQLVMRVMDDVFTVLNKEYTNNYYVPLEPYVSKYKYLYGVPHFDIATDHIRHIMAVDPITGEFNEIQAVHNLVREQTFIQKMDDDSYRVLTMPLDEPFTEGTNIFTATPIVE